MRMVVVNSARLTFRITLSLGTEHSTNTGLVLRFDLDDELKHNIKHISFL